MPLVVIPCLRPVPPKNGKILGDPFEVLWNAGEYLEYECDQLFVIVGASKVFCSPDGTFVPHQPICGNQQSFFINIISLFNTINYTLKTRHLIGNIYAIKKASGC